MMIVYGSTLSPFVRKLMAYMAEKGLSADIVPAGMGQETPGFIEASPFGKMPGFRDPGADNGKDFCISDSTAIITYLEAKYPAPALLPADPIERARTVWFEEFADTIMIATMAKVFFNRWVAPKFLKRPGDEATAAGAIADELPRLLDYLETVVTADGYLVGGRLTLADLAVASPFVNLGHCDVTIDAAHWPKSAAYVANILARPSFAPMIEAENRMVAAMA